MPWFGGRRILMYFLIFVGISGGERRWAIDGANFPVFVSCA